MSRSDRYGVLAHVDAGAERPAHRVDVSREIRDAVGVVDRPVDVVGFGEGCAVLADHERWEPIAVPVAEVDEQVGERRRHDRPLRTEPGHRCTGSGHELEGDGAAVTRRGDRRRVVEVHAVEVARGGDQREVALLDRHGRDAEGLEIGIRAGEDGVGEDPVVQQVVDGCGGGILPGIGRGDDERVVVDDPDLLGTVAAQCGDGQSVAEQLVVDGRQRPEEQLSCRGELAHRIALKRRRDGFVQGVPVTDAVAQRLGDDLRVLAEAERGVALEPPSLRLQGAGQIPVVQRRERRDPRLEEVIRQTPVVVEAGLHRRGARVRLHAHPRDREPVAVDAERSQDRHILGGRR